MLKIDGCISGPKCFEALACTKEPTRRIVATAFIHCMQTLKASRINQNGRLPNATAIVIDDHSGTARRHHDTRAKKRAISFPDFIPLTAIGEGFLV